MVWSVFSDLEFSGRRCFKRTRTYSINSPLVLVFEWIFLFQSHNDPEETRKRAMKDPEVQAILADPAMRMILEQMQTDPQAIGEHLKNPEIAAKFMKLRESGLISVAYK